MLHHFNGGYSLAWAMIDAVFEPSSQQIFAMRISPVKIKAAVAHKPGQHAITAGSIQVAAAPTRWQCKVQQAGQCLGNLLVSAYQPRVSSCDGAGICLIEPVRVSGT